MSRTIETFEPLHAPRVGLYACGLTVYDYTHLGHLRKYTMDDVLIKMLRFLEYQVTFVQNVTDVGHLASDADTGEDKLEKGAKKYGRSVWDIAREFEAYFFYSMDAMGVARPDISCRATEHIRQQLEMVIELEKKGYAYVIPDDGVYYDTTKFPDYDRLARLNLEKLKEGARVEVIAGKRSATDFALWKFERPGENRAMVWESPWHPRSFPGWHIECSAMAMHYLGEQLDIHTGGIDHIPVHHTNEIAQAEAASGKKPFVKYWVHHNFLRIEGEKMSKSLGNFFTIDDIKKRGYNPRALRLLFLMSHYRSELNFTWAALDGAQKSLDRLLAHVRLLQSRAVPVSNITSSTAQSFLTAFIEALENDLATPEALAILWSVVKSDLSAAEQLLLLETFDTIFSLDLLKTAESTVPNLEELPGKIQALVDQRARAREQKDWQQSDRLREQIEAAGYKIEDTATGQKITRDL